MIIENTLLRGPSKIFQKKMKTLCESVWKLKYNTPKYKIAFVKNS